jgi:hypothetical protein
LVLSGRPAVCACLLAPKVGLGVRHALFPVCRTLGAFSGRRLPDAVLRGRRSCRPRSRAVRDLAARGFLSEASVPASPEYDSGWRTRFRQVDQPRSLSGPLRPGTAAAAGGTFARGDGSGLLPLRLRSVDQPAVPRTESPVLRKVSPPCPTGAFPKPRSH